MSIPQLISILHQLKDLHGKLLESGEQKKQAIVDNDVKLLNQLVTNEGKWIKQVAECERERISVIKQFLVAKGYKPSSRITVAELAKLIFNAEEKKEMLMVQQQLLKVLHEVKQINDSNQQLLKQSLQFIEFSIDLMAGPGQDDWMYQQPGHSASASRNRMFDTRA